MRRINEQKIIRLLQDICFYGTAILGFGFATHVTLFWNSPKPETPEEAERASIIYQARMKSDWSYYGRRHNRLPYRNTGR